MSGLSVPMPRRRAPAAAAASMGLALLTAAGLLAGCGSGKHATHPGGSAASTGQGPSTSGGPTTTGAVNGGAGGGAAQPAATGTPVAASTPAGNKYTVSVTVTGPNPNPKPPCAVPAQSGRQTVGFTLVVANTSGKDEPSPPIGLLVNDNPKLGNEVVAMSVDNSCIDFLLTGDTIKAGASVTYTGAASNITNAAKLVVNMKEGTIGNGQTQAEFALVK